MHIKIKKARQRMIQEHPFHACLLYRLAIVEAPTVTSTMATDGKSIYYNPAWIDTITVAEVTGVLAHECMHIAFGHHLRRGDRVFDWWNIDCDKSINGMLIRAGFTLPAEGVFPTHAQEGWSAERHYAERLKQQQDDQGEQQDEQPGDQDEQPGDQGPGQDSQAGDQGDDQGDDQGEQPGDQGDQASGQESGSGVAWGEVLDAVDDDGNALDDAGRAQEQRNIAAAVHQAAQAERRAGKGSSGDLRTILDSLRGDPQPWHEILAECLADTVAGEECYSTPDRRMIARGLILPDFTPEPNGTLVLGVDTSGSLDDRELGIISGHINDIVADINPVMIYVVYCDATVTHVDEFERGDDITLAMHGGGGTEFNPVFNWCEHNDVTPDALVYFTDGFGCVGPEAMFGGPFTTPDYPVIWCTSYVAPTFVGCQEFGEVIEVQ